MKSIEYKATSENQSFGKGTQLNVCYTESFEKNDRNQIFGQSCKAKNFLNNPAIGNLLVLVYPK